MQTTLRSCESLIPVSIKLTMPGMFNHVQVSLKSRKSEALYVSIFDGS